MFWVENSESARQKNRTLIDIGIEVMLNNPDSHNLSHFFFRHSPSARRHNYLAAEIREQGTIDDWQRG